MEFGCNVEVRHVPNDLRVKTRVLAQWQSGDNQPQYEGTIESINDNESKTSCRASYKIKFKDGDVRLFCPLEDIKAVFGKFESSEADDKSRVVINEEGEVSNHHKITVKSRLVKKVMDRPKVAEEQNLRRAIRQKMETQKKQFSYDACLVLKSGNDLPLSDEMQRIHGRAQSIVCLVNIGKTTYNQGSVERKIIRTCSKTLQEFQFGITSCKLVDPHEDSELLHGIDEVIAEGDVLVKVVISYNYSVDDPAREMITNLEEFAVLAERRVMTLRQFYQERSAKLIQLLDKARIKTNIFLSPFGNNGNYHFVMLGITEGRLKEHAEKKKFLLQLNQDAAYRKAQQQGLPLVYCTNVRGNEERYDIAQLMRPFVTQKKFSKSVSEYIYNVRGIQHLDEVLVVLKKYRKSKAERQDGELQNQKIFPTIKFYSSRGSQSNLVLGLKIDENNNIIRRSVFNGIQSAPQTVEADLSCLKDASERINVILRRSHNQFKLLINDETVPGLDFDFIKEQKMYDSTEHEIDITVRKVVITEPKMASEVKFIRRGDSGYGLILDDWKLYATYKHSMENDRLYQEYPRYGCDDNDQKKIAGTSPWTKNTSLFSDNDRTKILLSILTEEPHRIDIHKELSKTLKYSPIETFYPLHNQWDKKQIKKIMLSPKWYCGIVGIDEINAVRNYFGEQIAFYYGFMGFYTRALIIPAIFGTLLTIWQHNKGTYDVPMLPIFAIGNVFWSTFFIEKWKRNQANYRAMWGMTRVMERKRSDFHGTIRLSKVDGTEEEYVPPLKRCYRYSASFSVILTMCTIVILSISAIFLYRSYLIQSKTSGLDEDQAIYFCSFLAAIQIKVYNVIYVRIALYFTQLENHSTYTSFQNSLMFKTFCFKFINSYKTMLYTAFIQEYDIGCNGPCMPILRKHLLGLFLTSLLGSAVVNWVKPWFHNCCGRRDFKRKMAMPVGEQQETEPLLKEEASTDEVTRPNRFMEAFQQFYKSEYDGTFADFDQVVIRYGYLALFVVVLPIMPLLLILSQVYETKLDSWSLLVLYRRPEPRSAGSIGAWGDIICFLGYFAILTNVGILYNEWGGEENMRKLLAFIVLEHLLIFFNGAVMYFIPDQSSELDAKIERQKYLEKMLILNEKDPNMDSSETEFVIPRDEDNSLSVVDKYFNLNRLQRGPRPSKEQLRKFVC